MSTARPQLGLYVARRLLQALPLALGVVIITFVLIHLAPGDPIYVLAGDGGSPSYYAAQRAYYGLDQPLLVQLGRYLLAILHGDFGYSFSYQQPALQVILSRAPATLLLMGSALLFSTSLGVLLGVVGAAHSGRRLDLGITGGMLAFYAMPVFWLGQIMIIIFAVWLKLFPVQGMVDVRASYTGFRHAADVLHHLALPALTLGLIELAVTARLTRTSMRETLGEDYVRTATAKGLPRRQVLLGHALRNALLPVVTVVGGQIGVVLTGAALTETIFAWPGLGRLLLDATLNRDYPILMGIFILVSLTVVLANLAADLLYALLDPRVSYT